MENPNNLGKLTIEQMEEELSQPFDLKQPTEEVNVGQVRLNWRHYPHEESNEFTDDLSFVRQIGRMTLNTREHNYTLPGGNVNKKEFLQSANQYFNPHPAQKMVANLPIEQLILIILTCVTPLPRAVSAYILRPKGWEDEICLFGFSFNRPPSRKFLSAILETINPKHWLFKIKNSSLKNVIEKMNSLINGTKNVLKSVTSTELYESETPLNKAYLIIDVNRDEVMNTVNRTEQQKLQIAFVVKNLIALGATGLEFNEVEKEICPYFTGVSSIKTKYEITPYQLNATNIKDGEIMRKGRRVASKDVVEKSINKQRAALKKRYLLQLKMRKGDEQLINFDVKEEAFKQIQKDNADRQLEEDNANMQIEEGGDNNN